MIRPIAALTLPSPCRRRRARASRAQELPARGRQAARRRRQRARRLRQGEAAELRDAPRPHLRLLDHHRPPLHALPVRATSGWTRSSATTSRSSTAATSAPSASSRAASASRAPPPPGTPRSTWPSTTPSRATRCPAATSTASRTPCSSAAAASPTRAGSIRIVDGKGDRELEADGTDVTQLAVSRNAHWLRRAPLLHRQRHDR